MSNRTSRSSHKLQSAILILVLSKQHHLLDNQHGGCKFHWRCCVSLHELSLRLNPRRTKGVMGRVSGHWFSWIMADQLQAWRAWFWDAEFWLTQNTTWEKLEETKNPKWVQSGELFLCFPVAFVLIALRFVFERWVVRACKPLLVFDLKRTHGGNVLPAFHLGVSCASVKRPRSNFDVSSGCVFC